MARTREEIKQSMIDYVANSPILSVSFTSPSAMAIWRLAIDMVSFAIWVHEGLWELFKLEVEALEASAYVHTDGWYAERMLEYQHGDALVVDDVTKQPSYAVLDESKRVITQVAVVGEGISLIKCAKGGAGSLEALDSAELTGALSYLRDIQSPGIQIGLVSLNADLLKLVGQVKYKGTLTDAQVQVEAAVDEFLSDLNAFNFNGELKRSDLISYVRSKDRIEDFFLTGFEGKRDGGAYQNIERAYFPFAGYSKVDPSFPLSSNLTYTPV